MPERRVDVDVARLDRCHDTGERHRIWSAWPMRPLGLVDRMARDLIDVGFTLDRPTSSMVARSSAVSANADAVRDRRSRERGSVRARKVVRAVTRNRNVSQGPDRVTRDYA